MPHSWQPTSSPSARASRNNSETHRARPQGPEAEQTNDARTICPCIVFFAGILRNVSDGRNGIGHGRFLHIPPGVLARERTKAPPSVFPFRAQDTNENGLTFRLQPAGFDVCTFLKSPRNPLSRHTIKFASFRFTDLRDVPKSQKSGSDGLRRTPSSSIRPVARIHLRTRRKGEQTPEQKVHDKDPPHPALQTRLPDTAKHRHLVRNRPGPLHVPAKKPETIPLRHDDSAHKANGNPSSPRNGTAGKTGNIGAYRSFSDGPYRRKTVAYFRHTEISRQRFSVPTAEILRRSTRIRTGPRPGGTGPTRERDPWTRNDGFISS